MDKRKANGTMFRDRAFSNVYAYAIKTNIEDFHFDLEEINGLVKINAKQALQILEEEKGSVTGYWIKNENGKNVEVAKNITFDDFLINKGETGVGKYGEVLQKVIELQNL